MIGGFFAICLLIIFCTVMGRSFKEWRQARTARRKERIENHQIAEVETAVAERYPGLFESSPGAGVVEKVPEDRIPDSQVVMGNEGWKQGTRVNKFAVL